LAPGTGGTVIGGRVGWITVTVLVLVLGLALEVEVDAVGEVVSVTVAGGTGVAAVVVTVDVEMDVETDVLVAVAGLSTPQATRWSDSAATGAPMSAPWCSTIDEPWAPLSWSAVKLSLVATSLPEPSKRTSRGGRSPLAGWPVCPGAWKCSPAEAKSASHLPTA
jgi:hypothetical protein